MKYSIRKANTNDSFDLDKYDGGIRANDWCCSQLQPPYAIQHHPSTYIDKYYKPLTQIFL